METLQKTIFKKENHYQEISKFTLLVYFRKEFAINGSEQGRKLHSYKNEIAIIDGKEVRNEMWAFNKLHNLIKDYFKGKYVTAIIYHNESKREVCRYAYDAVKFYNTPIFDFKDNTLKTDIVFTRLTA